MARPLRIQFPDAFYHVFSRGNDRGDVFRQESDYALFLDILNELCKYFHVVIHSYCLMKNHFHLLIQTKEPNLADFMKRFLGKYTARFNRKYSRAGHLFQGRYKSILIDKDSYLLEISRYIHLNPCKAGIVKKPNEYKWSSFRFFVERKKPSFLEKALVLDSFKNANQYRKFVMEGLNQEEDPFSKVIGGIFLGPNEFIERFKKEIGNRNKSNVFRTKEILKTPVEIIERSMSGAERDIQMYALRQYGKLSHREIGERFGIKAVSVSQALGRLRGKCSKSNLINDQLNKIDQIMSNVDRPTENN